MVKQSDEGNFRKFKDFVTLTSDGFFYLECRKPIDITLPIEEQVKQFYDHTYIEECNPAMAKIYGVDSPDIIIGRKYQEIHQGNVWDAHNATVKTFLDNGYRLKAEEFSHENDEGDTRYFMAHAVGIVEDGYLKGLWGSRREITEKKTIEIKARHRENLYNSLLEHSPMGVLFVDPQGIIKNFNPAFNNLLGYEKEELIGCDFRDLTHPEDVKKELALLIPAMKEGLPSVKLEKRFLHKDGHPIWTSVGTALIYGDDGRLRHAVAMVVDVNDRNQALKSFQENEALLTSVLKALPDLKFRINLDGVFVDYYPAESEEDLLLPPESFLGKTVDEILPVPVSIGFKANMLKAHESGLVQIFEYALSIREEINYFEARISALNDTEFITVIRNISERKKAQRTLQEKIQELDVKNRQLQKYIDSNLQLENFAYIASHDLREPLRTMSTFAQLLQRRYGNQLDEQGESYIEFINKGAANLNQLIEDLLTYSRVNTGDQTKTMIDVNDLLEEVKKGLAKTIQESKAVFYTKNLPESIHANAIKIKQLFQNLIANAIKFRQEDQAPYIEISARDTGSHWQFKVADNGIGIKPDYQETIFLLFKKLHGMGDYEGTGLGLAICKKVVEQHQGDIWVESTPGEGSTFYFTLKK